MKVTGETMYEWLKDLFPINRSITGEGVRTTLNYIQKIIPDLKLKTFSTGEKVFDWEIPEEWKVNSAFVICPEGNKILDFSVNNLHLVGYSISVDKVMELEELQNHLYSIEEQPKAIPYITSYYSKNWGFCISHEERLKLKKGKYRVVINTKHFKGVLDYGELLITEDKEVLLSTYICHPSMANNELSGPVVLMKLIKWLYSKESLRYSYRIIFIPETIGSIAYISRNYNALKDKVIGGFVLTCVGDDNNYSLLKSKYDNSIFEKIGRHVLIHHTKNKYKEYTFLQRGSDERQFSSPGVDLDCISLMRSKYCEYEEYHTSLDNLDYVSPAGLKGGYEIHRKALEIIENNDFFRIKTKCEPQLGKRGLYPPMNTKESHKTVQNMMNLITFLDGKRDLLEIAEKIDVPFANCLELLEKLKEVNLVELV